MNEFNSTRIEIDGKFFDFSYYSYFNNYYVDNGKNIEPQTREWFLKNLNETDVIFDIGAHIGLYTILFSQRTQNIYSFEPTSTYDTLLLPNLEKNNINCPVTEKLALGTKSGNITDKIFRVWGKPAEESEYPFITIDEYVYTKNISPTFLKIDVDSFDYEVLLGGERFLTEFNPYVCVECNSALNYRNHTPQSINEFMNKLGYNSIHILDDVNVIYKKNGINI